MRKLLALFVVSLLLLSNIFAQAPTFKHLPPIGIFGYDGTVWSAGNGANDPKTNNPTKVGMFYWNSTDKNWTAVTDLGGIPLSPEATIFTEEVTFYYSGTTLLAKWKDAAGSELTGEVLGGGSPFSITSNVISNANGDYATDDFVVGSPSLVDDGNTDHDTRMFFDKSKGAFRAGTVADTRWDDADVGVGSFAVATNNTASGTGSACIGVDRGIASGNYSVVIGGASNYSYAGSTGSVNIVAINSITSGVYAVSISGDLIDNSARYGVAIGSGSNTYLEGMLAHSSGRFKTSGDNQVFEINLRADTTSTTPEDMYIDNDVANNILIPASTLWHFEGKVLGAESEMAATFIGKFEGVLKRDASNNTTLLELTGGSPTAITSELFNDCSGFFKILPDDTLEALKIEITGSANFMSWEAGIKFNQLQNP